MSGTWKRWQDWLTVVVGVLLFVAPFIFGAGAGTPAALTAYIGGVLLVIAAVWSLSVRPIRRLNGRRLLSVCWCSSRRG